MTKLEIKHLKLVKTIAETGNITRAAKKLYITQPALSRQLADIESRLETPLFHRTQKKMVLTKVGEMVFETAAPVLKKISKVELNIEKHIHGDSGLLSIGVHCVLCYKWLPSVMAQFKELFPNVIIEIRNSEHYLTELSSGKVDMVITSYPVLKEGICYEDLFRDEVVVVMPAGFYLSEKKKLFVKDFEGLNMIGFTEKAKDSFYIFYLKPAGIEPSSFMKVQQPEAIIELVKQGFGVALLPRWSVADHIDNGSISAVSFCSDNIILNWKIAISASKESTAYQRKFIELISDQAFVKKLN
ncbi:MAG: LysR family transcriptional regulator [Desulfobacterales bacterium]|nr:LysR family transcriptional regulator [Desulfobacterales bacterium]MCP4161592.1 LysR family transcriptional regulator [Deltaproteobacteria bacterium]